MAGASAQPRSGAAGTAGEHLELSVIESPAPASDAGGFHHHQHPHQHHRRVVSLPEDTHHGPADSQHAPSANDVTVPLSSNNVNGGTLSANSASKATGHRRRTSVVPPLQLDEPNWRRNPLRRFVMWLSETLCCSPEFGAYSSEFLLSRHPVFVLDTTQERLPDLETELYPFIVQLCKTLLQYGSPIYRTEDLLMRVCARYGVEAQVACLPGLLMMSLGRGAQQKTTIVRLSSGLHCEKLHLVDELTVRVIQRRMLFSLAQDRLREIIAMPPRYPWWMQLLAFGVSSACVAPLFYGAGWWEALLAFGLGVIVGVLGLFAEANTVFSRIYEAAASLVVALLSRIIVHYFPHRLCFNSLTLAGVVWLLPGLGITMAMFELASRNIISGTSRFFGAFMVAVQIGFGLVFGSKIAAFVSNPPSSCVPPPEYWNALFLPLAVLSWLILLSSHPWQWPLCSVCATVGYVVSWGLSKAHATADVSTAAAAFAIGMVSNTWSRLTHHSAVAGQIAGIMMLVPGSIGVRGVSALLQNNITSGVSFAFNMIVIALSIGVGLFVANLLVLPLSRASPATPMQQL